jgi:hypothetical protein
VEHHQATLVNWLIGPDHSPLETTIAYEQVAIDVTAAVAQNEPDPYLAQVYRFGLLEDFDHMYRSLGGDPTAQTPEADVSGVEGMGLMQVLTDPKTTVAQALHAILVAEMTDNAAWEELVELTTKAGNDDLVARFIKAHEEETEHLEKVRGWYRAATQAQA